MSTKDEIHTKNKIYGNFLKKASLNPSKSMAAALHPSHFATALQNCKSFKGVEGFFTKNLSKLSFLT